MIINIRNIKKIVNNTFNILYFILNITKYIEYKFIKIIICDLMMRKLNN